MQHWIILAKHEGRLLVCYFIHSDMHINSLTLSHHIRFCADPGHLPRGGELKDYLSGLKVDLFLLLFINLLRGDVL